MAVRRSPSPDALRAHLARHHTSRLIPGLRWLPPATRHHTLMPLPGRVQQPFATGASATARRRPSATQTARRRRREEEDGEDPWGNLEISEVRIVYDPYHSSRSSASSSIDAYVSPISASTSAARAAYVDAGSSVSSVDSMSSRSTRYDPYARVSTASKWSSSSSPSASTSSLSSSTQPRYAPRTPEVASTASSATTAPPPFPRPLMSPSAPPAQNPASNSAYSSAEVAAAEEASASSSKSPLWKVISIMVLMGLQLWDMQRSVNKAKEEAKRKQEEERAKRSPGSPSSSGSAAADAAATATATAAAQHRGHPPSSDATATQPTADGSNTIGQSSAPPGEGEPGGTKANSLALWVSRQKRLNRTRVLQRKLEKGLTKNERDAVLKMCVQSTIEAEQAREILSPSPDSEQSKESSVTTKTGRGSSQQVESGILIRKVLADKLGPEVQVRDYTVVKTTLQSNTTDASVWVQESRQVLQSRMDPSRRVVMDIRTRIVETKEKPSLQSDEEGLILVENNRDLLQEVLQLMRRPTGQESDSRVATYVEKVDMTFGPSVCLEFEFDNMRIS